MPVVHIDIPSNLRRNLDADKTNRRNKVALVFDALAASSDERGTAVAEKKDRTSFEQTLYSLTRYDIVMGEMTNHYRCKNVVIDDLFGKKPLLSRNLIDQIKARGPLKSFKILDVGCGSGYDINYLMREQLLQYVRQGLPVEIVLVDTSFSSLVKAQLRLEALFSMLNGSKNLINVFLINLGIEDINPENQDLITHVPCLAPNSFDLATAIYVASWFDDPRLAYTTISLLLKKKKKLLSIEEHPLVATPNTPMYDDIHPLLQKFATKYGSISEIRALIGSSGFTRIESFKTPIDDQHKMFGTLFINDRNLTPNPISDL